MSRDLSAPEQRRLLLDSVRDYLEQLAEEGLEGLPATAPTRAAAPKAAVPAASVPARDGVSSRDAAAGAASPPRPASAPIEMLSRYPGLDKTATLEELRAFIGDCQRCKLAPLRTHLVFGVGNPEADLMFVGEAPGADEDARGEPFVGRAGQLLTDIIERGMGLRRADVYICNVIKCRPPDNRNPEADEVAACEPFLMPTFHPAYLLRSPGEKRWVWQDIQEVMKLLGIETPARGGTR